MHIGHKSSSGRFSSTSTKETLRIKGHKESLTEPQTSIPGITNPVGIPNRVDTRGIGEFHTNLCA